MNSDEKLTHADSDAHATAERLARERAIMQIERRRRYWINTDMAAFGLIIILTEGYSLTTFPDLPALKLWRSARREVFHNSTGKDERFLRMTGNPGHGNGPSF